MQIYAEHRAAKANHNPFNGRAMPVDLMGFDYGPEMYDKWHAEAPTVPAISSETSSAYSDRGQFKFDKSALSCKHGLSMPLIICLSSPSVPSIFAGLVFNNRLEGHVRDYDTEHPSWGQTAEAFGHLLDLSTSVRSNLDL